MRFMSNLLGDSKNLHDGLATESAVLGDLSKLQASLRYSNVVEEYSQRTEDSENWGFSFQFFSEILQSLRNIYTLSSVSRRIANKKSTKIGEPQAQLPVLLLDSKNLGECLA
jgi:hypothetical protein